MQIYQLQLYDQLQEQGLSLPHESLSFMFSQKEGALSCSFRTSVQHYGWSVAAMEAQCTDLLGREPIVGSSWLTTVGHCPFYIYHNFKHRLYFPWLLPANEHHRLYNRQSVLAQCLTCSVGSFCWRTPLQLDQDFLRTLLESEIPPTPSFLPRLLSSLHCSLRDVSTSSRSLPLYSSQMLYRMNLLSI
jgi:hypothetical protein